MKKIAVGDLGEFWYGDYKEPFEQLEGGVPGHPVGVVLKADDGKVLCAYCGKTFDNLGRHVRNTHGMSSKEYKDEVGLLRGSSLSSERLRLAKVAQGKRRLATLGREKAISMLREGHAAHRVYGPNKSARTPEKLNQTGRCFAQLLAVGRTILRESGRITQRTLRTHGISEKSVLAYWPTLDDYRRAVGDGFRSVRPWSDVELLTGLRELAHKLGRTPSASDLRRYGLPWLTTYARRFGSYSSACERAGLDPNLPTPLTTEREVAFLVAYATVGRTKEAARLVGIGTNAGDAIMARYGAPFAEHLGGNMSRGTDTSARKAWAADMARRLAGMEEQAA